MTWQGVRTVAALELRQRLRTSRWPIVMTVWVLVIGVVAGLTWYAMHDQLADRGRVLYDVVLFFVLGLGMLVVPSLTATSVNGDREHGVLATLQTTLLTPAEIVGGKLVASWAIALTFLVAAGPFLLWAWLAGGIHLGGLALAVVVLAFVLAVVCAIGLMFSTLTARTISSAVLTYLAVAGLTFGTVIAFLLSLPVLSTEESVTVRTVPTGFTGAQPTAADCVVEVQHRTIVHPERTWWLLALNPFVVVADAAPARSALNPIGFEPLQMISDGARGARLGEQVPAVENQCWPEFQGADPNAAQNAAQQAALSRVNPVWPYGLVFLAAVGAGAAWVAVRRVRTPLRRLPRGTRVA